MSNVIEAPNVEQFSGTIDMAEFEAEFEQAVVIQAAGELAMQQQVAIDGQQEAEVQMLVGFNPNLLSMFLRATPGSELSNNLANLMVADVAVNNAEAYGLFEQEQARATENLYHYVKSENNSTSENEN
jgi:hypothetical protein